MKYTIRGLRVLDDIRLSYRIPTITGLGKRTAHHHQPEFRCNIRCSSNSRIHIRQRPGSQHGNVSAKLANLLNQILNPIRSINGASPFAPAGESCRHSRLGVAHRPRAVHTRTSTQRRMSMNIPRQIPANRNNLIGHIHRHIITRHIITRHTSSISQSPGPCQPSIPQSIIPVELGTPCIRNKRISPRRMLRP